MRFGDRDVLLDQALRERLSPLLRLRRGSAVNTLVVDGDSVLVTFRRCRPPLVLEGPVSRLVAELDGAPSVRELSKRLGVPCSDVLRWARELELTRVIHLDLPEESHES
jgi:hypothetical protein